MKKLYVFRKERVNSRETNDMGQTERRTTGYQDVGVFLTGVKLGRFCKMGLKFPIMTLEALDETCLGAVRFGALEESDRVFDNETAIIREKSITASTISFGNPDEPKIARRVKFPADVDLTGFKRRDPVKLIDPEYHVVYIPAQDGNREYSDLVIYAKGLGESRSSNK